MTNKIILSHLGINGRMISGSKSGYCKNFPKSIAVFNANIIAETSPSIYEKIWFGDLDITNDEVAIRKIALELGCKIWVLPELAARFEHEEKPLMGQYIFMTDGKDYELGNSYYKRDNIERDEEGKLILKQQ
jgi:hypothetical protein